MKSVLIKDTTKTEREEIIRNALSCGGGCENCSSCWLGGGSPWEMYRDYIDGRRETGQTSTVKEMTSPSQPTFSLPRMRSTISFAMERPMPKPDFSELWDSSCR